MESGKNQKYNQGTGASVVGKYIRMWENDSCLYCLVGFTLRPAAPMVQLKSTALNKKKCNRVKKLCLIPFLTEAIKREIEHGLCACTER